MKIELKNLKHAAFASEETHCFTATVYIDGKRAGVVSNDGKGADNIYQPHDLQARLNAYGKTLPKMEYVFDEGRPPHVMEQDAESLIGDLVNDALETAALKRQCKKVVLFRIPGQAYAEGEYQVIKAPFSEKVEAHLEQKYGPGLEIVNKRFMPQVVKTEKAASPPIVTVKAGQAAPIW